jgi:transposase-like protein
VGNWGKYHRRPGLKRYMCKSCERTFNDLTNTLLDNCKLPLQFILLVIFFMCIPLTIPNKPIWNTIGAGIITLITVYIWLSKKKADGKG